MSHANARLTFHGRCGLVRRVRIVGRQPASPARLDRSDHARGFRTAILTPDRGLSRSRITRVHATEAGPDPRLMTYNTERGHHALGGYPPISRLASPT